MFLTTCPSHQTSYTAVLSSRHGSLFAPFWVVVLVAFAFALLTKLVEHRVRFAKNQKGSERLGLALRGNKRDHNYCF
jgi:hypothetical protein